jgi:peptidoglycan hydrolase CwlO-like protein
MKRYNIKVIKLQISTLCQMLDKVYNAMSLNKERLHEVTNLIESLNTQINTLREELSELVK